MPNRKLLSGADHALADAKSGSIRHGLLSRLLIEGRRRMGKAHADKDGEKDEVFLRESCAWSIGRNDICQDDISGVIEVSAHTRIIRGPKDEGWDLFDIKGPEKFAYTSFPSRCITMVFLWGIDLANQRVEGEYRTIISSQQPGEKINSKTVSSTAYVEPFSLRIGQKKVLSGPDNSIDTLELQDVTTDPDSGKDYAMIVATRRYPEESSHKSD